MLHICITFFILWYLLKQIHNDIIWWINLLLLFSPHENVNKAKWTISNWNYWISWTVYLVSIINLEIENKQLFDSRLVLWKDISRAYKNNSLKIYSILTGVNSFNNNRILETSRYSVFYYCLVFRFYY